MPPGPTVHVHAHGAPQDTARRTRRIVHAFSRALGPAALKRMDRLDLVVDLVPSAKVLSDLPEWEWAKGKVWTDTRTDSGGEPDPGAEPSAALDDPNRVAAITSFYFDVVLPDGRVGYIAAGKESLEALAERLESEVGAPLKFVERVAEYPRATASPGNLIHELGHVLWDTGLTTAQITTVTQLFESAARERISEHAGANAMEYFAESVRAYLGYAIPQFSAARATPGWLQQNDPKMFALLTGIFAPTRGVRPQRPTVMELA